MESDLKIEVRLLRPTAKCPKRGSEFAAAYDLYTPTEFWINPGEQTIVNLGIAVAFTPGWGAMVFDRSGLGARGIHRQCGLIDSDYRGEWKIILRNHSELGIKFSPGDRIAQVVFSRVGQVEPVVVEELDDTDRSVGGFGSTGA